MENALLILVVVAVAFFATWAAFFVKSARDRDKQAKAARQRDTGQGNIDTSGEQIRRDRGL